MNAAKREAKAMRHMWETEVLERMRIQEAYEAELDMQDAPIKALCMSHGSSAANQIAPKLQDDAQSIDD